MTNSSLSKEQEPEVSSAHNAFVTKLARIAWSKAFAGMILTCVLALSVHVIMLQVLNIPYPSGNPNTGWPVFCNLTLTVLALIYFYRLAVDEFASFSLPVRCLLLFILVAMLRETLIRSPVMNGFATTAWRYSFVANLPRLLTVLLTCCLVVPLAPRLGQLWRQILGSLLIAAFLVFLYQPLIARVFEHLLATIDYLSHDEVYKAPYGWQIEVPAYLTYLEPVVACFLMVALVWDRLEKDTFMRTLQFVLLVLMIDGALLRPFIYVFYTKFSPVVALLSMGQFSLEALALALLTTFTWRFCQR